MKVYADYYVDLLKLLWQNIVIFCSDFFGSIGRVFSRDIPAYFAKIGEYTSKFSMVSWVIFVIVTILTIVLLFFIFYRLFQLIRKYIVFRKKEVEKEKLLEEIESLREETQLLMKEKMEIFSLKVNGNIPAVGGGVAAIEYSGGGGAVATIQGNEVVSADEEQKKRKNLGESRFSKLIDIDMKYAANPHYVCMKEDEHLTLSQIVDRFINFAASQLKIYYGQTTIRNFFASMATSKIIILEGISGTGKTSLPYSMGKFFCNKTAICSVQPSWRDRAELIGYLNEFTKKFNESSFLASLYETTYRDDPSFIVLDEMNLSRIEYYFAEFLSILEMPNPQEWIIDIVPSSSPTDPKHIEGGKMLIPQNVWFIGTANNDDSTFSITDKVYDRANALTLNTKADPFEAPKTEPYICTFQYLNSLFEEALVKNKISDENLKKLKQLDEYIFRVFHRMFGNRIMKQINTFVPVFIACGGDEIEGLDFMISTKILRKFGTLNLAFMGKELKEFKEYLNKLFGKDKMKFCLTTIEEFEKQSQ